MSVIGLLLPLIFVIFLISFIVRAGVGGNTNLFKGRYIKRVVFGYLVILLASPIVLYFIQGDEMKAVEKRSGHEVVEIQDRFFARLYDEGKVDFQGLELRHEFELEPISKNLTITHASEEFYRTVIIEENKSLDEKVLGKIYLLPSVIDDLEVTHAMPTLQVELSGDRLTLGNPSGYTEINMRLFEKEFTINQFTGKAWFSDSMETTSMNAFGDSYLYLQIPEDMTVVTEGENIELIFVGE